MNKAYTSALIEWPFVLIKSQNEEKNGYFVRSSLQCDIVFIDGLVEEIAEEHSRFGKNVSIRMNIS